MGIHKTPPGLRPRHRSLFPIPRGIQISTDIYELMLKIKKKSKKEKNSKKHY